MQEEVIKGDVVYSVWEHQPQLTQQLGMKHRFESVHWTERVESWLLQWLSQQFFPEGRSIFADGSRLIGYF